MFSLVPVRERVRPGRAIGEMHVVRLLALTVLAAVCLHAQASEAQLPDYTLFESDPVTPIALSPDGSRLFAVNTPDGYLEIFEPTDEGRTTNLASVPVGLEPVSVAVRNDDEVWVVNHLSDSVSVVDVSLDPPRVVRTLLVGDEPRGIVFAGPGKNRAFIATAHRGQNTPWPDGDYDVPGTGRADVWVFDANNLGTSLAGNPITVVQLFGDRPRALAASPDGSTVYAAVFRSGNRTVPLNEQLVCDGPGPCNMQGTTYPAGQPFPKTNFAGIQSRESGIIVGFNDATGAWEDELGNDWSGAVRFSLPDLDVFEIDANASPPVETDAHAGVGTVLFNMVVNPANGKLYVSNTEANNRVRFEGFGEYVSTIGAKASGDPPSVRGNLHRARITVIDPAGVVTPRPLNKHIPYGVEAVPAGVKEKSVATPLQMVVSSDGSTVYVAGFGSNTVAIYDSAELENDTFVPSTANLVSIEGPTGLALDEARGRLWVSSRMTNGISSIDLATRQVTTAQSRYNPEPLAVRQGRKFLYDASLTSSNGEASCSSCHIFGDMDDLTWDLGDPDLSPFDNPNPTPVDPEFPRFAFLPQLQPFDPLKGPMTTQSLRGMKNAGPMHWRGDRTGGATGGDPLDSNAAFLAFNPAFPGLLGRDEGELPANDMQAFTDFALALTYPPNPIRSLDNALSPAAAAGQVIYNGPITDTVANCNACHVLDRSQGFFGTSGRSTFENETMEFKVPHLRNAYQKVGMFGQAPTDFFPSVDPSFMGDQVRGTGFLHDGSVATTKNFLSAGVFGVNNAEETQLESFMMEFDSDLAPIVGQQVTVAAGSGADTLARVDLLVQRADTTYYTAAGIGAVKECDLIAKGVVNDAQRGWFYLGGDQFESDLQGEATWSKNDLLAAAAVAGQVVTFTCVPPGSGRRMGIDRDRDGQLDANDTVTCAAGPIGDAHRRGLSAFSCLLLAGLLVRSMRRREY